MKMSIQACCLAFGQLAIIGGGLFFFYRYIRKGRFARSNDDGLFCVHVKLHHHASLAVLVSAQFVERPIIKLTTF